jgi:hypothetical protein
MNFLNPEISVNIPKYSFLASHKTQCIFTTKSSQLMLFRETGAIPVEYLTGKIAV